MATPAPRTPLALLETGASPDLRDARLLAWLFDPAGEHGLGRAGLVALGAALAAQGTRDLSRALVAPTLPPLEAAVRLRGGEVEVVVTGVLPRDLVGAVRSRPRGPLAAGADPDALVFGVGPSEDVFPPEVVSALPVLGWEALARALDAPPAAGATEHGLVVALRDDLRARLAFRSGSH